VTDLASKPRPDGIVVRAKLTREHGAHGRIEFSVPERNPPPVAEPVRRPARIAQMLALAHHIDRAIEAGTYADQAHAARSLGLTRARITQLRDLLVLAPDIQEELLFLESVDGVEPTTERAIRPMLRMLAWGDQREWRRKQLSASLGRGAGERRQGP
jgi:hypothetical protein